ncbi:hypothetical protein JCM3766R1_003415 [Sporobolomyces carnicolor]
MPGQPFTDQQLVASFFGWVSTGFGTALLVPAWFGVMRGPEGPIEPTTGAYFAAWLIGDALHLTALLLENVGPQTYVLYIIVATAELLILLTLMWKAHLFCCQSPLPKEFRYLRPLVEMTGYTMSIAHPDAPETHHKVLRMKPGAGPPEAHSLQANESEVNSQRAAKTLCLAVTITVWYVFSVKRLRDIGEPKASSWPHDLKSTAAFAFGVAGFFFWTGPRVYVLYKKRDDISTSSVVLGVAAHLFNMLNIGVLNFVAIESAAACSPFFLTSLFCIILDFIRLYRKKKLGTGDNPLQWKLPTSRERHDKKTRKRQEGQEERAWRRKQRRIAPVGTEESVAEVNKRIGRLNVRGEGLEKDLRGLLNVLQNVQAGNSQEFKDEWEEICDRENWSNRTGGSLSRAEPAHSARRTNESDTFDNEAAEVKLIAQLAFGLEGPLYQYFADKLRGRQQRLRALKDDILRALKDDISNELRDTRQQAKKEPDPRRHTPPQPSLVFVVVRLLGQPIRPS